MMHLTNSQQSWLSWSPVVLVVSVLPVCWGLIGRNRVWGGCRPPKLLAVLSTPEGPDTKALWVDC